MVNENLRIAGKAGKDEFYTQIDDIANELKHYKNHFKEKIVLCNCDDPYKSNFFKYFALNFNDLKLKKLIATCCNGLFVQEDGQMLQFDFEDNTLHTPSHKKSAHKIEITEINIGNSNNISDLSDVRCLLQNGKNNLSPLKGNGDFRSIECIEFLKQADIVVTNPPFSLFREYIAQLIEYQKKFLIIRNVNAITYKGCFQLIKENKMWLGVSIHSGDREFQVPKDYPMMAAGQRIDEMGNHFIRVKGVRWFTNMDYKERHKDLNLYKHYTPEEYPKYDNYNSINVNKTTDIPMDYDGIMGVPITFLDKYNPE